MAIALSDSGVNITEANPLSVAIDIVANDYVIGAFETDSQDSGVGSFESPMAEDVRIVTNTDSMTFYAASGRASGTDTALTASNGSGSGGNNLTGAILAFSGVDLTTALDDTIEQATDNAAVTTTSGLSVTTTMAGVMLVLCVGWDQTNTTDPTSGVDDGGAGLSWTIVTAYQAASWRKGFLAYALKPSAGSITVAGTTDNAAGYGAALYALRPAGGGGTAGPLVNGPLIKSLFGGALVR